MKNAEYWQKRFVAVEAQMNKKGRSAVAKVAPAFDRANAQIQKEINNWYQRFADNNGVSMVEAKKMLNAKDLAELKWDVNDYIKYGQENAIDPKWMKQLENASAKQHITRLEALQIRTQQAAEAAFGTEQTALVDCVKDVYTEDYYHTAFEIQKGTGVGYDIGQIDNVKLDKLIQKPWTANGLTFSDNIWQQKQKLVSAVHTELTQMCILGKAPDEAIKNISKLCEGNKKQAGRLVMTEAAYFASEAQTECFADLDVEEYEIVATLDSHTSEICQQMDGQHFKLSDKQIGVNAPPFHPWCRTTTVPYFDDEWGREGTRAAKDEDGKTYQVPADMTYEQWKKKAVQPTEKPKKVQEPKVQKKTINDFNTTSEIEDYMKSKDWFIHKEINGKMFNSNEYLSLSGCDVECSKDIFNGYETVFNKYPEFIGKMSAVGTETLRSDVYAQCSFGLGNEGVTVNTKWFGKHEKIQNGLSDDVRNGFHPVGCDTPKSVVLHEIGHAVDGYLTYIERAAGYNGWQPKTVSSMLRPKVMKAAGFKVHQVQSQVSMYATKDAQEWFAECFSEWMCSENPRPVAMEFGKQLEELLKGIGMRK